MTSVGSQLSTRNATLADMAGLLQRQHADKLDVVVPAAAIHSALGDLHIAGTGDAVLSTDGVTSGDGVFTPTAVCDAGIAEKFFRTTGELLRKCLGSVCYW